MYNHNQNRFNHQQYTRSDNVPGQLYLIEAIGYHGIFPGCFLRRVKIGLSRNPQMRLETFHANQPPGDLKILRTICVQDMAACESWLHEKYHRHNVKLHRSKEWFDFNPIDFLAVWRDYDRLERQNNPIPMSRVTQLLISLLLIGMGLSVGLMFHQAAPQQPQNQQSTLR